MPMTWLPPCARRIAANSEARAYDRTTGSWHHFEKSAPMTPSPSSPARELQVLRLVAAGKPNKQIATELFDQRANGQDSGIYPGSSASCALSSRTQAALWAVREGLVEVKPERH